MSVMKLGQLGDRKDQGTWFFITINDGRYVTWTEDEDKEVRGLLDISPEDELPQIKVRRFHDSRRSQYLRKAFQRYRKIGQIPPEAEQRVIRESVAHTTLLDWRLIAFGDGEIQDYSPKAGMSAFNEDPDFYEAVIGAALEEQAHRDQAVAEDVETLGEASSGISSGDQTSES